ncbi:MAG: glucose 1-dehydrogenase [Oscillospiraceae bacterium]|nr:glucose 1-dehydrogenase [Oscillospiraceae bacterium]
MRLKDKSIVVTGASSGMGKAIVSLFAKEGANVIAVARRKERLEELALSLKECPGKVVPFPGDVSKQEDIEAAIDAAVKEFGKLDVLVNNAGVMDDMSPIGDFTNEKLAQVFEVNVFGPMYAMRKAVNVFKGQGSGGNIINVASLGAMRSCAGAVYCASKAAVVSLTKNTSFMYQPDGIRVNAIAPGGINTEISSSMGMPNMAGYGRVQKVMATAPETGSAESIANAALFLASDESAYINGDVLVVDGGWNAG